MTLVNCNGEKSIDMRKLLIFLLMNLFFCANISKPVFADEVTTGLAGKAIEISTSRGKKRIEKVTAFVEMQYSFAPAVSYLENASTSSSPFADITYQAIYKEGYDNYMFSPKDHIWEMRAKEILETRANELPAGSYTLYYIPSEGVYLFGIEQGKDHFWIKNSTQGFHPILHVGDVVRLGEDEIVIPEKLLKDNVLQLVKLAGKGKEFQITSDGINFKDLTIVERWEAKIK